jgi:cytochrome c-type biogenesis protein CcmH/NrfF
MREKVMAILATQDLTTEKGQDKAYIAVRDAFMKEYGGQIVLTVPIDTGFNRLGWIVPWVVFALALGLVIIVGRRFVKRGKAETAAFAAAAAAPAPKKSAKDEELEDRLDDELRDID